MTIRRMLPQMTRTAGLCLTLLSAALMAVPTTAKAQKLPPAGEARGETWRAVLDQHYPRLVVVLTFDQFRADFLTRYSNHFLPSADAEGKPGGFRYLMENGATMADNHYNHMPLHTGPGHATILTGASPRFSGIVANDWNTSMGLRVNCVADPDAVLVGLPGKPPRKGSSSPRNLLAQTVGDELKLSNNGRSKVYGIAIKDRGAILPAGHAADGAVWFDSTMGRWVTSTYYTTGTLPAFAQRFNDEKVADRWYGKDWDYLLPKEVYDISMPEGMTGVGDARGLAATFPKKLSEPGGKPDRDYYNKLIFSPYGNEMVFETAKMAIQDENLGGDSFTDILAVSFSTTDLIGHSWGGHSREAQDSMLRVDRQLSDFLGYLKDNVPGGMDSIMVVVTGDHGGMTLPEYATSMKLTSGRLQYEELDKLAKETLSRAYPDKQTTDLITFSDPHFVFRLPVFEQRGINVAEATDLVADAVRKMAGITAVYTRAQIESGAVPNNRVAQMVTNGYNPDRCGEMIVVSNPLNYNSRGKTGSTHGTPWNYDSTVPLIFMGKHVRPGVYPDRTDVRDIAPTLSFYLGLTAPASSEGRILTEIVR